MSQEDDQTRRLGAADPADPAVEPTRALDRPSSGQAGASDQAGAADRTAVLGDRGAAIPPPAPPAGERTRVLGAESDARRGEPAIYTEEAYTEDYGDQRQRSVSRPAGRGPDVDDDDGRRWTTMTLVLSGLAALLIGAILTLLLLPEENAEVVLADQQAQAALDEAVQNGEAQQARIAELEAAVAERDAQIASQQAQAEGDQAATDQAQNERETALNERDAALGQREASLADGEAAVGGREQAVAEREAAVAAAEQAPPAQPENVDGAGDGTGGFELPDVPQVELPGELPQIDDEAARGLVERFIDRIESFFE